MVHKYDLALAGIAGSLSGGALVGFLTGLPIYVGLGLGAIPGVALMLDAVFLNPPTQSGGAGPTNGTGPRVVAGA